MLVELNETQLTHYLVVFSGNTSVVHFIRALCLMVGSDILTLSGVQHNATWPTLRQQEAERPKITCLHSVHLVLHDCRSYLVGLKAVPLWFFSHVIDCCARPTLNPGPAPWFHCFAAGCMVAPPRCCLWLLASVSAMVRTRHYYSAVW